MMEAAARQRQLRINRKYSDPMQESSQDPEVCTFVSFVASAADAEMVKVPTGNLNMTQSRSMCRAKIPANLVNSKEFRSESNKLTFIYTKTTKMIQIQGGATMLDKAHDTLVGVLGCYNKLVQDGEVMPMPDGTQAWGKAIKDSYEAGSVSKFLDENEKKTSGEASDVKKQVMVPNDPEFDAAVAELCSEGARKLHHFPGWRNKFLQFMLKEFNASTDQVLELSCLSEKADGQDESPQRWFMEEDLNAKPKVKASGYRRVHQ